jgi:hypothetical protein
VQSFNVLPGCNTQYMRMSMHVCHCHHPTPALLGSNCCHGLHRSAAKASSPLPGPAGNTGIQLPQWQTLRWHLLPFRNTLRSLGLAKCNLGGVLGNLTYFMPLLSSLSLSSNALVGQVPEELGSAYKGRIWELSLNNNSLTGGCGSLCRCTPWA